jgi:hypothetical protein
MLCLKACLIANILDLPARSEAKKPLGAKRELLRFAFCVGPPRPGVCCCHVVVDHIGLSLPTLSVSRMHSTCVFVHSSPSTHKLSTASLCVGITKSSRSA